MYGLFQNHLFAFFEKSYREGVPLLPPLRSLSVSGQEPDGQQDNSFESYTELLGSGKIEHLDLYQPGFPDDYRPEHCPILAASSLADRPPRTSPRTPPSPAAPARQCAPMRHGSQSGTCRERNPGSATSLMVKTSSNSSPILSPCGYRQVKALWRARLGTNSVFRGRFGRDGGHEEEVALETG